MPFNDMASLNITLLPNQGRVCNPLVMKPYGGLDLRARAEVLQSKEGTQHPLEGTFCKAQDRSQKRTQAVSGGKVWRTARDGFTKEVESEHLGWV